MLFQCVLRAQYQPIEACRSTKPTLHVVQHIMYGRNVSIHKPRLRSDISQHCSLARRSLPVTGRYSTAAVAAEAPQAGMRVITSISEINGDFQFVLLDQFGVLHDGQQPYPHAIAAVEQLHAAGKQVLVLSNSSRRSGGTIGKLAKMGFKADWFAGAITSGELTHRYLSSRPSGWCGEVRGGCTAAPAPAAAAAALAPSSIVVLTAATYACQLAVTGCVCDMYVWRLLALDASATTHAQDVRAAPAADLAVPYAVVDDPGQADFILAHGTEALALPLGGSRDMRLPEMQALLQQCAQQQQGRRLPMVVANPDLWLAIGDSLEHDIAGAVQAGVKTLLIIGGIHAGAAQLQGSAAAGCSSSSWDEAALQQLCQEHQLQPDFCMAYLQK
ncbi:HAD-like domain-containing protein [Scenedesmus sp. NREL 46B-D3]|nr:HAD-like domain-containing protein [Scenedesmus sp. NREL 46B-D3]